MLRLFSTKKRVVYFPGCITSLVHKDLLNNWISILSDLGIEFEVIEEIKCCGSPAYTAGYLEDFSKIVRENKQRIGKVDGIISNCPHCVYIFSEFYDLPAVHTSQVLAEHRHLIRDEKDKIVSYHDPCTLARKLGIVSEPRKAILATGLQINEFKKNKYRTSCCGASGGLIHNNPALANKIARDRLRTCPEETVVVSCPLCYHHLKNQSSKINVKELSEIFFG